MFYVAGAFASVTVTVNGSNHTIPQTNEKGWGANVTAWIQAISQFTLQPNGGTFTLTGEVNTGNSYGFKVPYIKTATASPSTVGVLRLANTDSVGFRNAANDGNLLLAVDSSNQLTFNGAPIGTTSAASFQDSTFNIYDNGDATKKIAFQASGISGSTTRTITMPDANVDLGVLSAATDAATNSALVRRDGSGNFSAGTITASLTGNVTGALTGNASTATALAANPSDCGSNTFAQSIVASGNLTCAAVSLSTADTTGTLGVAKGGTGLTTLASNQLLIGLGSTSVGQVGIGTSSSQVVTWNGSTYATETNRMWTDSASQMRTIAVRIVNSGGNACNSNPCTAQVSTGGFGTLTRDSQGNYTINFSPAFAAAPVCTCGADIPGARAGAICGVQAATTASVGLATYDVNGSTTAVDTRMNLICMGLK